MHRGSYAASRRYHVWINGNRKRSDCRGLSEDGASNYTHLITPAFSLYDDRLDPRKSQFNARDPKQPVGWGTLGTVIDVSKIGLVNWSIESLGSHSYDEDLLPKNRRNMRVETDQRDGKPITIVKMDCRHENTAESWSEFWLSPTQGNYPIYLASGWTDKESPHNKYVVSQQTQWEQFDGVWFPTSVKYRYQCEDEAIDDTSNFELVAARFSVTDFPDVFDPANFVADEQPKRVDTQTPVDDDPFSAPTQTEIAAAREAAFPPGIFGKEDHESTKRKVIAWIQQSQSKVAAERHAVVAPLSKYFSVSRQVQQAFFRLFGDRVKIIRASAARVLFLNVDEIDFEPIDVMRWRFRTLHAMALDGVHSDVTLPFLVELLKTGSEDVRRVHGELAVRMLRLGQRDVLDQIIKGKEDPAIVDKQEYYVLIETLKDELTRMARARLDAERSGTLETPSDGEVGRKMGAEK